MKFKVRNDLNDLEITKRRGQGYSDLAVGTGHPRAQEYDSS